MATDKRGRRKPYTQIGIRRLPCFRCGRKPSVYQWRVCADGNVWRPLCGPCDVAMNAAVLRFMRHPHWKAIMAEYRRKVRENQVVG